MSGRKKNEKFRGEKLGEKEPIKPRTEKQKEAIRSIFETDQIVLLGPAGVGKTFLAAGIASDMLERHEIDKIVLTRPNIGASKSLGFLPGSLEEKFGAWIKPYTNVMEQRMGKGAFECHIKNENIEIVPLEFIRGRDFQNCLVLGDEFQNTNTHELKTLMTRIGKGSKVILNGDISQKDIKQGDGLSKIIELRNRGLISNVSFIEFTNHDILRGPICKMWVEAFEADESGQVDLEKWNKDIWAFENKSY